MITWKNILHRLYIVYVHRLDALILSPGFGLSPSAIAAEIDPAASAETAEETAAEAAAAGPQPEPEDDAAEGVRWLPELDPSDPGPETSSN